MSKTYSPEEVAKAVLNRCKDVLKESVLKKAEASNCQKCKKQQCECKPVEKCGEMDKAEVEKCGSMNKSSKLMEFLKKKKKGDIKKMMSPTAPVPGSVATTGGSSIASQIGFGKDEQAMANKAAGLKPITSDKASAAPASDEMPAKPKAATTLKSYMEKKKK